MLHELKTWPVPFAAIVAGVKTHEIRKMDRSFAEGDVLRLREWMPDGEVPGSGKYTGCETWAEVTYMTPPGEWGLPNDLCVMSISPTERRA